MDAGNILDKVSENLSVRRAFGAPYEKDGTLIIPVALVAGGGGGGTSRTGRRPGGSGPGAAAAGSGVAVADPGVAAGSGVAVADPDVAAGSGVAGSGVVADPGATVADPGVVAVPEPLDAGGGFGGLVLPSGVYVVKGDQVRWVPAVDTTIVVLAALGLARLVVRACTRRRR